MKKLLVTSFLASILAFPAFAQMSSDDTTCADFIAMDASAQMEALTPPASDAMAPDAMASDKMADDKMAADPMASDMMATGESVAAVCADHPDMMLQDAMKQAMMAK